MSEQDNAQHARQAIAAINDRKLDQYLQLLDDSFVMENEMAPTQEVIDASNTSQVSITPGAWRVSGRIVFQGSDQQGNVVFGDVEFHRVIVARRPAPGAAATYA